MAMRGDDKGGVRVVIINTEYVETDAVSFKSVVQKLTGKDATVAAKRRPGKEAYSCRRAPILEKMSSFKDFDRMLKELPPLDELYSLYADNWS
ncbi:VQ motif-containing protein 10-like [Salvia miltiorrhiza]|uniref:VQ motif-containing protein 10-like n=1 Tax=Salvia miltiorrhiza TaxID=226208 RepID=UPI0025ACBB6F|nr:VQ motif-containing protein 10-like [Salvia miltiorrhiza]